MIETMASEPSEHGVKNLCGGGDNHRYIVEIDETARAAALNGDGMVYAYGLDTLGEETKNALLSESPQSVNQHAATGYLDSVGLDLIKGWACDKDEPSKSVNVHLFFGGTPSSGAPSRNIIASDPSQAAISNICGGGDNHRFSVEMDETIRAALDNGDGKVYAIGIDSDLDASKNSQLHQSPKAITNRFATTGFLDEVGYTFIRGWACDKDEPLKSIDLHFYFGGPAGSGSYMVAGAASDASEVAVKDVCGGGDNHRFNIEMDDVMRAAIFAGDGKVYAYGLDSFGIEGKNAQLGHSPKALKTEFAVRDCTFATVVDEVGTENLKIMLATDSMEEIETTVSAICGAAWEDGVESVPFSIVDDRFTDAFMGSYVAGDTFLNTETGTFEGTIEGTNIDTFRNEEATDSIVEGFPDIATCQYNSIMCCFGRDRQPNDNNGNCKDPIDQNCINADPADNSNLCFTDHNNHPYPGRDEGKIHCHGLAWSDDENDPSAKLKFNNFFYISLYDHMYSRGYVENMVDSAEVPMCGCIEDMPPVSRADCTEMATTTVFKINFDGTSSSISASLDNVADYEFNFNACKGINPSNGNRQNNDLASYVHRLQLENRISSDTEERVFETLVGYASPGDNDNEAACASAYTRKTGLEYPENNFAARGYFDSVDFYSIKGWACDQDEPTTSVDVHIYFGGPAGSGAYMVSAVASEPSHAAVKTICGGGDNHHFDVEVTNEMVDAIQEGDGSVYVYGLDTLGGEGKNRPLGRSPQPFNEFATKGYLDSVAGTAKGWACDQDDPLKSIQVNLYFGGPAGSGSYMIETMASEPSEHGVKNLCGGGDNHRYIVEIDETARAAALNGDGMVYAYGLDTLGEETKNALLSESPQSVNQHAATGYLDSVGLDLIKGWACDKDEPSKSVNVHLFFGGTPSSGAPSRNIIASDPSQAAISNICGGGDNHRFSVEMDETIRAALDNGDGKVYAIGIDSDLDASKNSQLHQSPKAITNRL